jgi:hypothetical protein
MFDIYYKKNDNSKLFSYLSEKTENKVKNIKNFVPIYSRFFSLNEKNHNAINLNHKYCIHNIKSDDKDKNTYNVMLYDHSKNKVSSQSFFKFSPLLDVTKFLAGKYKDLSSNILRHLPKLESNKDVLKKMECCNNCAYTDAFFSYLSSQLLHHHKFPHGIDFYGSFLGIKEKFQVDITDDLEYLYDYEYFHNNQNVLFETDAIDEGMLEDDTRKNRIKINIKGNKKIDIEELPKDIFDNVFQELTVENLKMMNEIKQLNDLDLNVNVDYSRNEVNAKNNEENKTNSECSSRISDTDDEEDDGEESDGNYESVSDDDDESEYSSINDSIYAYIYDFPCQIICLEKMELTLDDCVEDLDLKLSKKEWLSCLFQIVMMLITYQKVFNFTHNDLHTNNIMFNSTEKKYLNYYYNGRYWKIPTHGKLYKIIDYGRSIYTFKGKEMISDSFFKSGDAAGQYNFTVFKNKNKPELKPHNGFDLTRLACSLFDYFVPDVNEKITNPIAKLINEWVHDDNGKNILYKSNGDERYPDFKLYKMISRKCKQHTPQKQLENPIFKQFLSSRRKIGKNAPIINIDNMPSYV